jgi:hypothetical protein
MQQTIVPVSNKSAGIEKKKARLGLWLSIRVQPKRKEIVHYLESMCDKVNRTRAKGTVKRTRTRTTVQQNPQKSMKAIENEALE